MVGARANVRAKPSAKRVEATVRQTRLPTPTRARVLLVDDHELLRLGLRLMIDAEPDLEICGEAATEVDARRLVDKHPPDLVVADLSLSVGSGLDLTEWITKHHPRTKTVVSTMHDERIYGERVLRAGAWGYVSKSAPAGTILNVIRRVLAGEYCYSERLRNRALAYLRADVAPIVAPVDRLSNREIEVLRHLGTGLTSGEIASALHLSTSTVDTYRERIKAKLDLAGAAELTHYATRWVLGQD